jgi:transposase
VLGNLTAQKYCDEIIEPVVVLYLQQGNVGIFQHDNARPHTARQTQNILRIHNVNVLRWPARSPDLSPIEHLWDNLGRQVRACHDINNVHDLQRALQAEGQCWLLANGGHTRY